MSSERDNKFFFVAARAFTVSRDLEKRCETAFRERVGQAPTWFAIPTGSRHEVNTSAPLEDEISRFDP